MIQIYNFLLFILSPALNIYINHRKKIGKEDLEKFHQRKGVYNQDRPKGKLIWVHAVSVGETLSVIPLINKLCEELEVNIVLTTTTVTSANLAKQRLHKNAQHKFVPIDYKSYVQGFLNHFKPDLAIWVESELWPNLINESYIRKIPMILLNARISDKRKCKRFFYKLFAKKLISKFNLILPQEKRDEERIKELGANNIKYIGNLKLDAPALPFSKIELSKLKKQTSKRELFLAASTHPGEEKLIARMHQQLRTTCPNLLTIIVPRHPNRSEEICKILKEDLMISTTIRSKQESLTERTDIYLADTLGELGLFYSLCDISFIGGSLVEVGGHNPIEALKLNSIAITGSYCFNFHDMYKHLEQNKAVIKIDNISDLEREIHKLLSEKKYKESFMQNSQKFINMKSNILDETVSIITTFL